MDDFLGQLLWGILEWLLMGWIESPSVSVSVNRRESPSYPRVDPQAASTFHSLTPPKKRSERG